MQRIGDPDGVVAARVVAVGVVAHPLAGVDRLGPVREVGPVARKFGPVTGRLPPVGGQLGEAVRLDVQVDALTAAARHEPQVVEVQAVLPLGPRRREADVEAPDGLGDGEPHRGEGPGVVGRGGRVGERLPRHAVGAQREGHIVGREERAERERVVGHAGRQRDAADREVVRGGVVVHPGVTAARCPRIASRRAVAAGDLHVVDRIPHLRGPGAGVRLPRRVLIGPDPRGALSAEVECEDGLLRLGGATHRHAGGHGLGALARRHLQHAFGIGRDLLDEDRRIALARSGREAERRIGGGDPRGVALHGDDVRCGIVRIEEQRLGRHREVHRLRPAARDGDHPARHAASAGLHAQPDGRTFGHRHQREAPVTRAGGGRDRDGGILRCPDDLPGGVGRDLDDVARRILLVEEERSGGDRGVAVILRRAVRAGDGEDGDQQKDGRQQQRRKAQRPAARERNPNG